TAECCRQFRFMVKCGSRIHRFAMAILICPACGRRYEIQAVFPPEGRKARCYKCNEIWLAKPVFVPAEPASGPVSGVAPSEPARDVAPVSVTVSAPKPLAPPQSAAAVSLAQAFS